MKWILIKMIHKGVFGLLRLNVSHRSLHSSSYNWLKQNILHPSTEFSWLFFPMIFHFNLWLFAEKMKLMYFFYHSFSKYISNIIWNWKKISRFFMENSSWRRFLTKDVYLKFPYIAKFVISVATHLKKTPLFYRRHIYF